MFVSFLTSSVPYGPHHSLHGSAALTHALSVCPASTGMCTRAWRLRCLSRVSLLELDLPHMAALKRQLLAEAGAATVSGSDNSSCDAGAGEDQQVWMLS